MFFILSKLLVIFIYPLTWIILILIFALIDKNFHRRKKFILLAFVLLVIFTDPFLLDQFAKKWDIPATNLKSLPNESCEIILGGFSSEDRNQQGYFNSSSDRILEGLLLKSSGHANKILITGGNSSLLPSGFREADWVKGQLNLFNIPDTSIIIDNGSRNSFENAAYCKKILDSLQLKPPYILVTSAFHMRRSMYIFQKMGLKILPYSTNFIAGRQKLSFNQFIPEAEILGSWNFYIKEIFGYYVYKFKSAG